VGKIQIDGTSETFMCKLRTNNKWRHCLRQVVICQRNDCLLSSPPTLFLGLTVLSEQALSWCLGTNNIREETHIVYQDTKRCPVETFISSNHLTSFVCGHLYLSVDLLIQLVSRGSNCATKVADARRVVLESQCIGGGFCSFKYHCLW